MIAHSCNVRCVDGWHAMLMYSTSDEPVPDHFDPHFPGCITEHERAMEAPPHPSLNPRIWNAYVVRWRPA